MDALTWSCLLERVEKERCFFHPDGEVICAAPALYRIVFSPGISSQAITLPLVALPRLLRFSGKFYQPAVESVRNYHEALPGKALVVVRCDPDMTPQVFDQQCRHEDIHRRQLALSESNTIGIRGVDTLSWLAPEYLQGLNHLTAYSLRHAPHYTLPLSEWIAELFAALVSQTFPGDPEPWHQEFIREYIERISKGENAPVWRKKE